MSRKLFMLLCSVALVVGMVGTSMAQTDAKPNAASKTPSAEKTASKHQMHAHSTMSEVGNWKFMTTLVGNVLNVTFYAKGDKMPPLPVGDATGTATLTFADGTTKSVTLAKAEDKKGPEHLTGTWDGTMSPKSAAVQLSGLKGTPSDASYTTTFPEPHHKPHPAGTKAPAAPAGK